MRLRGGALCLAGASLVLVGCGSSKSTSTPDGGATVDGAHTSTSGHAHTTTSTHGGHASSSSAQKTATSTGHGSSNETSSSGATTSTTSTRKGDGGGGDSGAPPSASVLQRGYDLYRRSTYSEPMLTPAKAGTMAADTGFNGNAKWKTSGNTQGTASVLYLDDGPTAAGCPTGATGCVASSRAAGAGLYFAFPGSSSTPNVIAFDEASGQAVWTATLTTGNDGIRGTPVIDPASRRLFVVTGNNPHLVHALAVDTGIEATTGGWPVTLDNAAVSSGGTTFNTSAENQHGASLLLGTTLYIPFGGEYGDGGNYYGWVIAIDIDNPGTVAGWATQSPRSGIWGAGGLASDGTNIFAATGDTGVRHGAGVARNVSDSQEVLRLGPMASFTRSAENVFVATEWQAWDEPAGDLDFGASTPAYVPLPPGSQPSALLIAPAKAGRVFFLDGTNLSSGTYDSTNRTPGGSLQELDVSNLTGESVYTSPTVYTTSTGLYTAINVGQVATGCPGTGPTTKEAIMGIRIQPGHTPLATTTWCVGVNSGGDHQNYPPISTTDGTTGKAVVWFMDGSSLRAVDGDSGMPVLAASTGCSGTVPNMSWPIAVKNKIVVAALGQLCSWSIGGN
jgi:hypothetical protein